MPASQSRHQTVMEKSPGAPCLALRLIRNEDLLPLSPVRGAVQARCSSSSREATDILTPARRAISVLEDLVPEVCRPHAPRKAPPPKRYPHPYPPGRRCREGYKIGTHQIRHPFLGLHLLGYTPPSAPISGVVVGTPDTKYNMSYFINPYSP